MGAQSEGFFEDAQFNTSIIYILICMSLGEIFRILIRRAYTDVMMTPRILLHEMATVFEQAAVTYELQIISGGYGETWYFTLFFLYSLWLRQRRDPTKSSISTHLATYVEGNTDLVKIMMQIGVELMTGFLVYPLFIRPLWKLMDQQPMRLAKLTTHCVSDLKSSVGYGCWIEFIGSFILQLAPSILALLMDGGAFFDVLNCCLLVYVVHLGLNDVGGWYSPMLVPIITAGCSGCGIPQFAAVYWLAPIAGTALAYFSFRYVRQLMGYDLERKES